MMNANQTLKFKTMFEQMRQNLTYSRAILNDTFHLQQDDLMDDVDLSTSELEQSMRLRLRNREALFLKKIDEALIRIQEGNFGLCDSCGDDIELKRLEARPTTTQCVGCKEEAERRESLHIDGHKHKSLGKRIRLA